MRRTGRARPPPRPASRRADQPADQRQQRVELAQRSVGQPDPQPMAGMLGLGLGGVQSERRGDQRRERLDVGAHHDDVPRLRVMDRRRAGRPALPAAPRPDDRGRGRRGTARCGRRGRAAAARSDEVARLAAMSDCSQTEQGVGGRRIHGAGGARRWIGAVIARERAGARVRPGRDRRAADG